MGVFGGGASGSDEVKAGEVRAGERCGFTWVGKVVGRADEWLRSRGL